MRKSKQMMAKANFLGTPKVSIHFHSLVSHVAALCTWNWALIMLVSNSIREKAMSSIRQFWCGVTKSSVPANSTIINCLHFKRSAQIRFKRRFCGWHGKRLQSSQYYITWKFCIVYTILISLLVWLLVYEVSTNCLNFFSYCN